MKKTVVAIILGSLLLIIPFMISYIVFPPNIAIKVGDINITNTEFETYAKEFPEHNSRDIKIYLSTSILLALKAEELGIVVNSNNRIEKYVKECELLIERTKDDNKINDFDTEMRQKYNVYFWEQ